MPSSVLIMSARFADAEAEFLLASKPKEAIEMYTHQKDWVILTIH